MFLEGGGEVEFTMSVTLHQGMFSDLFAYGVMADRSNL